MGERFLKVLAYLPAFICIGVYFFADESVVYLFAATWFIVHAKGNEILEATKKGAGDE